MSELINPMEPEHFFRRHLLATVSACALIGIAGLSSAHARSDSDQPTVWIELGGQLERIEGNQTTFAPDFAGQFSADGFLPLAQVQRTPRYGNGFEGKVGIRPESSTWSFSASIRYGRSNTSKMSHDQTATPPVFQRIISIPAYNVYITSTAQAKALRFADATSRTDENHLVMDFQAGRDVGLGIFGGTTTINAGVRIAQFNSKSRVNSTANSNGQVPYLIITQVSGNPAYLKFPFLGSETFYHYHAEAMVARSFRGIGPSVSFDAAIPLVGSPDSVEVDFNIGGSGALLFGRQKASINHKTSKLEPIIPHGNFISMTTVYHHTYDRIRSRSVVVPNIGGFAGVSFSYSNAKIKLGYRGDFFFGAMDGGIDSRKTYDRNFYGPFATISFGLGG